MNVTPYILGDAHHSWIQNELSLLGRKISNIFYVLTLYDVLCVASLIGFFILASDNLAEKYRAVFPISVALVNCVCQSVIFSRIKRYKAAGVKSSMKWQILSGCVRIGLMVSLTVAYGMEIIETLPLVIAAIFHNLVFIAGIIALHLSWIKDFLKITEYVMEHSVTSSANPV